MWKRTFPKGRQKKRYIYIYCIYIHILVSFCLVKTYHLLCHQEEHNLGIGTKHNIIMMILIKMNILMTQEVDVRSTKPCLLSGPPGPPGLVGRPRGFVRVFFIPPRESCAVLRNQTWFRFLKQNRQKSRETSFGFFEVHVVHSRRFQDKSVWKLEECSRSIWVCWVTWGHKLRKLSMEWLRGVGVDLLLLVILLVLCVCCQACRSGNAKTRWIGAHI